MLGHWVGCELSRGLLHPVLGGGLTSVESQEWPRHSVGFGELLSILTRVDTFDLKPALRGRLLALEPSHIHGGRAGYALCWLPPPI